jgi:hypothetical protein
MEDIIYVPVLDLSSGIVKRNITAVIEFVCYGNCDAFYKASNPSSACPKCTTRNTLLVNGQEVDPDGYYGKNS